MTIVAITRPKVKRTRNTARRPGGFGGGLLRSLPSERRSHTAQDEAWAAAALNGSEWDSNTVLDQRAAEAIDRLCEGYCC
jgi:hypothetical protein